MTRPFLKFGLFTRIALPAVLPLVAVLVLAGVLIDERSGTVGDMGRLGALVGLSVEADAVVHELQRERGATAGCLSGNAELCAGLPNQRAATQARVERFTAAVTSSGAAAVILDTVGGAREALSGLPEIRDQVDRRAKSVAEVTGWYSTTIGGLLRVMHRTAAAAAIAPETARAATAYVALAEGKERAGQERAAGTSGFAAGRFDPGLLARMIGLAGEQTAYFRQFMDGASAGAVGELKGALEKAESVEVERMRKVAARGELDGITAPAWFAAATARIDALKAVEDRAAADVLALARSARAEALADLRKLVGICVVALVAGIAACLVTARVIARPLMAMAVAMRRLAGGDLDVEWTGIGRGDEIGAMAEALAIFRDTARERVRIASEQEAAEARAAATKRADMERVAANFEARAGALIAAVARTAQELEGAAGSMATVVGNADRQASAAAGTAKRTTENVQSVASATEELSASIQEISRQVTRSVTMVAETVEDTRRTGENVKSLQHAADRIGAVVELINAIAGQTNLLALNATIEAARAGAAGKGFAIVAGEVKALAAQTARATEEISTQVRSIQDATGKVVGSIDHIGEQLTEINDVSSALAAAVTQQEAATGEIARNIGEAAEGTSALNESVGEVTAAAGQSGTAATQVLASSRELSRTADRLGEAASAFLSEVRVS